METQKLNPRSYRYGVTEKKKADLDALTIQIIDTDADVQHQSAIVASLTEKAQTFNLFLTEADNNRTLALSNKNTVDQVVQNSLDLKNNSEIALTQMVTALEDIKEVAIETKTLVNKLIFSVEVINKLSNVVIQKKALNPLISDELISKISKAGTDANNAVALTLIALKSIFATQATALEAESTTTLERQQANSLYSMLTGNENTDVLNSQTKGASIQELLDSAYENTKEYYTLMYDANNRTILQLNIANVNLNKVQIKLKSLESGLAAANAAALA